MPAPDNLAAQQQNNVRRLGGKLWQLLSGGWRGMVAGCRWFVSQFSVNHWMINLFFILISVDATLALCWGIIQDGRIEPWLTFVGIVTTLVGLLIDRWLTPKEQRLDLVMGLVREVHYNRALLACGAYRVVHDAGPRRHYHKLSVTAMDSASNSGPARTLSKAGKT